ncbi:MAG: hypothetical protein DMF78_03980 [Acidobacteria bacterium]|nr:MAG: hypothetical protein DMF78_03980 [Acidobacteriota bacterium]
MAENPVATLARLLAGVVLTQGRLGHQVLGQMLIFGSNEVAVAGATLVVAGTTRQRSAFGQVALRTAAPALAARGLIAQDARRVERGRALLAERKRRLEEREQALAEREEAAAAKMAAVEEENRKLHRELDDATKWLRFLGGAPAKPPSTSS